MSQVTRSLAVLLLWTVGGCLSRSSRRPFAQEQLDSIAADYVGVALALGERDPDSLDFAVVPSTLVAEVHRSYPPLSAIDAEAGRLLSRLNGVAFDRAQEPRAAFLEHQLLAVQSRTHMLQGHPLDFASEARTLFNVSVLPDASAGHRLAVRRQVAGLLGVSPRHSDATAAAYGAYDRRFLVPPERLPAVMRAALASCRQQTLKYLSLPSNEEVDLAFVRNRPWSAFSRFHGNARSTIEINAGFPITVDQALELACHEGYPGHHVFNTLRDVALVQQEHLAEGEVQLTFSPQSYLSESAAAFAPRLAFTEDERLGVERDILFPLAGLPTAEAERYVTVAEFVRQLATAQPTIAQRYLDGELEFVRAADELRQQCLMDHGEATLLYLNEYRSYMLAYTQGPREIGSRVGLASPESTPTEDRRLYWKRYRDLITGAGDAR